MKPKILLVDDEMLVRRLLGDVLGRAGYDVVAVGSVAGALGEVQRQTFDLVLLDVMLPDGDGFTACRQIRMRHRMPIVMLTAKAALSDRIAGLELGADDYIVKPFEPDEVVARVKAHLRRVRELGEGETETPIHFGALTVDPALQDAVIGDRHAGLTQKEFRLLHLLAMRLGKAARKEWLLEQLWSDAEQYSEKILAVYIRRIRQKIEQDPDHPEFLVTVRGFGYRLGE